MIEAIVWIHAICGLFMISNGNFAFGARVDLLSPSV